MLKIDALSVRFGGVSALVDVSLTVERDEIVGLIGPNGSGKTTLFNAVTGVYRPVSGRVSFAGADITGLAPDTIARRGIARTFQNLRLYQRMTVLDNVRAAQAAMGGATRARLRRARALLDAAGLARFEDRLAPTLPLPLQRRLELARALAMEPRLLLLDEPAGGMTPVETQAMAKLIREIAAPGRAVIVIEHKMSLIASLCARVVALSFGQTIAEGPPGEVLKEPSVLEAYLGTHDA